MIIFKFYVDQEYEQHISIELYLYNIIKLYSIKFLILNLKYFNFLIYFVIPYLENV